jgi:uncharacterized protein (DUF1330 family)
MRQAHNQEGRPQAVSGAVEVTLCVMLWAVPGREDLLIEYEDRVLRRATRYGARLLSRARAVEGAPTEVQLIVFPSEQALSKFQQDPEREKLGPLRARAIERTTILQVELVEGR